MVRLAGQQGAPNLALARSGQRHKSGGRAAVQPVAVNDGNTTILAFEICARQQPAEIAVTDLIAT